MKFYYDCESNGFPGGAAVFHDEHRIVQLCACRADCAGDGKDEDWFKAIVNPLLHIPAASVAIHRISNARAEKEGRVWDEVWGDFVRFMERCCIEESRKRKKIHPTVYLIAHNNFGFDMILLKCECERLGLHIPDWVVFVDTLPFFKARLPERAELDPKTRPYSLASLYQHYMHKDIEGAHDAGNDVKALKEMVEAADYAFSVEHTRIPYPKDTDKLVHIKGIGPKRSITIFHHLQHQTYEEEMGEENPNKSVGRFRAWALRTGLRGTEHFLRRDVGIWEDQYVLLIISQLFKRPVWSLKNNFPFCPPSNLFSGERLRAGLASAGIRTNCQLKNAFFYHGAEDWIGTRTYLEKWVHKNDVFAVLKRLGFQKSLKKKRLSINEKELPASRTEKNV